MESEQPSLGANVGRLMYIYLFISPHQLSLCDLRRQILGVLEGDFLQMVPFGLGVRLWKTKLWSIWGPKIDSDHLHLLMYFILDLKKSHDNNHVTRLTHY